MSEKPSFYELLGVTEDATDAQIRSAYYKIAKTAHPDRNTDSPTATEEVCSVSSVRTSISFFWACTSFDMANSMFI